LSDKRFLVPVDFAALSNACVRTPNGPGNLAGSGVANSGFPAFSKKPHPPFFCLSGPKKPKSPNGPKNCPKNFLVLKTRAAPHFPPSRAQKRKNKFLRPRKTSVSLCGKNTFSLLGPPPGISLPGAPPGPLLKPCKRDFLAETEPFWVIKQVLSGSIPLLYPPPASARRTDAGNRPVVRWQIPVCQNEEPGPGDSMGERAHIKRQSSFF
jgi:hypothetical protein